MQTPAYLFLLLIVSTQYADLVVRYRKGPRPAIVYIGYFCVLSGGLISEAVIIGLIVSKKSEPEAGWMLALSVLCGTSTLLGLSIQVCLPFNSHGQA